MKIFNTFTLLLLLITNVYPQTPGWHALPNAPVDDSRFEDVFFINTLTGWIVSGSGEIYKTTDGGDSWPSLNTQITHYLRSTGFFDVNNGIIGTLGDSTNLLYRTSDGGDNWSNITQSIQGALPRGVCGISIVDSLTGYASGKYSGPASFLKTTNAGLNWISMPVDTSLAKSLVDCYFWSADSGVVVGGYNSVNNFTLGHSIVLMTVNGGLNWTRVYYSTRTNEWCWKIQYLNRQIGYVSLERFAGTSYYLKTTNGGLNWTDNLFMNNFDVEGIGFINETTGWIGGWGVNQNNGPTYETTNSGTSWHLAGWGINMNRIRFLSDTLAYAVGKTVYKFTGGPIGIQPISTEVPEQFSLHQNYPNPFNPETNIRFEVPLNKGGFRGLSTKLIVFNTLGQQVTTLVNEQLKAGLYEVRWNAADCPSGIYFYNLQSENFNETRKLVLLK